MALADKGASVAAAALEPAEVEATVSELKQRGAECIGLAVDLSKDEDIKRLVAETAERLGRIDILVNVAGVQFWVSEATAAVEDAIKAWDTTLAVNLRAPYLCSLSVLPHMRRQGSGTIVNISSILGIRAGARIAAYCSTKAGLIMLTESLAQVLKDQAIKVYAVCPGGVDTKMARDIFPNLQENVFLRAEEVAEVVAAVATGESGHDSGSTVVVTRQILQGGNRWEDYQRYFLHR